MIYSLNFLQSVVRKKNIPVFIYFIINILIIMFVFNMITNNLWYSFAVSICLYFGFLVIILSPIGEFVLRIQNGCKRIEDERDNRLQVLFDEVYQQAKEQDQNLQEGIKLFINDDLEANAFATGRKTILCTKGMLRESDETIKGVLAHEFRHLSHHDTDYFLMVYVGNFMITTIILLIKAFFGFLMLLARLIAIFIPGDESLLVGLIIAFCTKMSDIFVNMITWIYNKVGELLVLKNMRSNEFEADSFACEIGYRDELINFLSNDNSFEKTGFFDSLKKTHPDSHIRIERMINNG